MNIGPNMSPMRFDFKAMEQTLESTRGEVKVVPLKTTEPLPANIAKQWDLDKAALAVAKSESDGSGFQGTLIAEGGQGYAAGFFDNLSSYFQMIANRPQVFDFKT